MFVFASSVLVLPGPAVGLTVCEPAKQIEYRVDMVGDTPSERAQSQLFKMVPWTDVAQITAEMSAFHFLNIVTLFARRF